tara:strand:+ start:2297 stop:3340 length:1044 start_codon:yes stop_codon:yes gene_type:complete
MANAVFSPRDFKAYVIEETTTGNGFASGYTNPNAPAITADLHQLDIDSVAFPSLSPNQVTAVRSRGGRVLNKNDFFQDNEIRALEVSLSGTFHKDVATTMLMQSVTATDLGNAVADVVLGATPTGVSGKYGQAESNKTFSLVLASPDTTDGFNIIMLGCLCTSFTINADITADGGLYKFEATISSGRNPVTNNAQAPATASSGSAFGTGLISLISATSADIYVGAVQAPVISSFSTTIESPAVYTGFSDAGYHSFARGAEFTVTANATIKYDLATRALYDSFNTQTAVTEGNFFAIPQASNNCGISMPDGFLTDVTFNEGDAMMLDVAMQGVNDGTSSNIIEFDQAS